MLEWKIEGHVGDLELASAVGGDEDKKEIIVFLLDVIQEFLGFVDFPAVDDDDGLLAGERMKENLARDKRLQNSFEVLLHCSLR